MTALDDQILDLMRRVSERAILPRYRNLAAGEVEDKGGNDPVTIADKDSEALLREGLAAIDASLAFVGEETAHADPAILERLDRPCWIVDPVDGTRNFAAGKPPFGIIIARADGGVAQSGWIYDCLTGRFCSAHRGAGAMIDGERVASRPTGQSPPVAAMARTMFPSSNARSPGTMRQACCGSMKRGAKQRGPTAHPIASTSWAAWACWVRQARPYGTSLPIYMRKWIKVRLQATA